MVPYIGFAEYDTCYELGKMTARLFEKTFPGVVPRLIVTSSRTVVSDIERKKGFIDGFSNNMPGIQIIKIAEDNGTVEGQCR